VLALPSAKEEVHEVGTGKADAAEPKWDKLFDGFKKGDKVDTDEHAARNKLFTNLFVFAKQMKQTGKNADELAQDLGEAADVGNNAKESTQAGAKAGAKETSKTASKAGAKDSSSPLYQPNVMSQHYQDQVNAGVRNNALYGGNGVYISTDPAEFGNPFSPTWHCEYCTGTCQKYAPKRFNECKTYCFSLACEVMKKCDCRGNYHLQKSGTIYAHHRQMEQERAQERNQKQSDKRMRDLMESSQKQRELQMMQQIASANAAQQLAQGQEQAQKVEV